MRKRKIKGNTLPEFLKKYFWEVDFKEIDLRKHSTYILIRLMEYGDEKAVSWIKKHFTGEDIANVLFHFKGISPRTANYWALMLGIDINKVLCLQRYYLKTQRKHWNY